MPGAGRKAVGRLIATCREGPAKAHTLPGDTVLTSLPMRPEYSYYAGRRIIFDVRTTEGFSAASSRQPAAWYAARTVPEGEGEGRLIEWLSARYRRVRSGPYRLFDLRERARPGTFE